MRSTAVATKNLKNSMVKTTAVAVKMRLKKTIAAVIMTKITAMRKRAAAIATTTTAARQKASGRRWW